MVLFDMPEDRNTERVRLRRFLRDRGFGYLQNSVWITPDPLDVVAPELTTVGGDVEKLLTLQSRPCCGESDEAIVCGAWDFNLINERYRLYLKVLEEFPAPEVLRDGNPDTFSQWVGKERLAWLDALSVDPMLPARLLPSDYLGLQAWKQRRHYLKDARL